MANLENNKNSDKDELPPERPELEVVPHVPEVSEGDRRKKDFEKSRQVLDYMERHDLGKDNGEDAPASNVSIN